MGKKIPITNIPSESNKEKSIKTDNIMTSKTLDIYLQTLDYKKIEEINIIAHTGKNTLSLCKNSIESYLKKNNLNNLNNLKINLLLKDPLMETSNRYEQVKNLTTGNIAELKKFKIDVNIRFYQTLPTFHGFLCKMDTQYSCFISFYYWENNKSKIYDKSFILIDSIKNPLINIVLSWFQQLYGKNNIHTIIFDFDDTIVNSSDAQIEAWNFTLKQINTKKNFSFAKNKFKQKLNEVINNEIKLKKYIKHIFLTRYETFQRYEEFFEGLTNYEIFQIEKIRFNKRQELTKHSVSFPNVKETLKELSKNYNLAIISATTENNIIQNLKYNNMDSLFSIILGSDNSIYEWDIKAKSIKIIKLSNLVGVPTNRMILIGDSTTDYEACKAINIPFIEASMIASNNNLDTLITYDQTQEQLLSFKTYENKDIFKLIDNINSQLFNKSEERDKALLRFLKTIS